MKELLGALNPLADGVMLSVGTEDGELIFEAFTPMAGRDSAGLPDFVAAELAQRGMKLEDVKKWSVGSGPGSFTALRLIAALASAWVYGKSDAHLRCVPGAVALAANLKFAPGDRIGCLYDGRNREVLYFGLQVENDELVPTGEVAVLNAAAVPEFQAKHPGERFVCYATESAAVQKIFGDNFTEFTAPAPGALLRAKFAPYDDNPAKLVYIRPAVHC